MNENKLKRIFADALEIDVNTVHDELQYNSIAEWDSIAHMVLIAAIDDGFEIMLETDDVIELNSFKKAKELLCKYGVEFE